MEGDYTIPLENSDRSVEVFILDANTNAYYLAYIDGEGWPEEIFLGHGHPSKGDDQHYQTIAQDLI